VRWEGGAIPQPDAESLLLARVQAGEAEAFAQWAASAEPALRVCLRAFAAAVDTEAVLQEALLRVWQVAPRFKPDGRPNALLRFAVTVTKNAAISELRRGRPTREQLDALEQELARETEARPYEADPFLRRAIAECRDKLPGKPKVALEQRLANGGTDDDSALATRLGMTLNTFLQNFTRARKLLAECLKKKGIALESEVR